MSVPVFSVARFREEMERPLDGSDLELMAAFKASSPLALRLRDPCRRQRMVAEVKRVRGLLALATAESNIVKLEETLEATLEDERHNMLEMKHLKEKYESEIKLLKRNCDKEVRKLVSSRRTLYIQYKNNIYFLHQIIFLLDE